MTECSNLIVKNIISHRISADNTKYEYNVRIKDNDYTPWVPEYFLIKKEINLLNSYKEHHQLNAIEMNNISQFDGHLNSEQEFNELDYTKTIALDFNESLGIKLEMGIPLNEHQIIDNDGDSFDNNSSLTGCDAGQAMKLESIDSQFDTEISNETDNNKGRCSKQSFLTEFRSANFKENVVIREGTDSNWNDTNDNVISDKYINGDKLSLKAFPKSKTDTLLTKTNQVESKETRKSGVTQRKETNVKLSNNAISTEPLKSTNKECIDEIFPKLSRLDRMYYVDQSEPNINPISLDLLKSSVQSGDIIWLQRYMHTPCKEKLQNIVVSNSYLIALAAQYNHLSIVAALLSLGASVDAMYPNQITALMHACDNENIAMIDLLVNNGAPMNVKSDGSNNILFRCASKKKLKSIAVLLRLGVNFNEIQINPPMSLEAYADRLKLTTVTHMLMNHMDGLYKNISDSIITCLGPNVKIDKTIVPIHVFSPHEIETIQLSFNADIPSIRPNHLSLLFMFSGLVISSGLKIVVDDSNKISTVFLNEIEQQSLIPRDHKMVTTFSPLMEKNILSINIRQSSCRKLRLILFACNIIVDDQL